MEHVVKAGLITEAEAKLIGRPTAGYSGNKWWMPLVWATKIVDKVRRLALLPWDSIYIQYLKQIGEASRRCCFLTALSATVQSGASGCEIGFSKCFLRVP